MSDSLHEQLMDAVVARISFTQLSGSLGNNVYKKQLPDTGNVTYPCILVTLQGCVEELEAITTETDNRILPVAVHILTRKSPKDEAGLGTWLKWQQEIANQFLAQSVRDVVPENWACDIRNMTVFEAKQSAGAAYQQVVRSFYLRFHNKTTRVRRR